METVSRFEANLLRLLYFFLRREPAERALPVLEKAFPQVPPCLSRGAVRLVKEALGKGCPSLLAQRGGWRVERHLRNEKIVEGRLWERTKPQDLGLKFSKYSMELLVWIAAARLKEKEGAWSPEYRKLSSGDLLLMFFAHEGLREAPDNVGVPELRKRSPFVHHGLCWLAYPEDFTGAAPSAEPDFGPWTNGVGACMLEALQPDLLARWVQIESSKERIANPQTMRGLGQSQERVLNAFLTALEKAERRDLARFLLRAAERLLGPYAHAGMWTGGLHTTGLRLADRAATYQAALVFVRAMQRLRDWATWARGVGYWDEGYQAAQLFKGDWEQHQGDALAERAQTIIRQLDPMRQG
jgi:hypothetical protein